MSLSTCLVPECGKETERNMTGIHRGSYLCEYHYGQALGYFERSSGIHIYEPNDVLHWIQQGMPYYPPICWESFGKGFSCDLIAGHEGDCRPGFHHVERKRTEERIAKSKAILADNPKAMVEEEHLLEAYEKQLDLLIEIEELRMRLAWKIQ